MKQELIRSRPVVVPPGDIIIPEPVHHKLSNGADVFFLEAGTGDVIRIEFMFHAGQIKEYRPLLASTTNAMLQEGSEDFTAIELHNELDFIGAFMHLYCEKDRAGLVLFSLNKHVDRIVELSHEILFRPVFPVGELDTLLKKRLQWFLISREKMQNLAMDNFFRMIFGKNHQYGYVPDESDFNGIVSDMLADFHASWYLPENMSIIISGKIPQSTLELLEIQFGSLHSSGNWIERYSAEIKSARQKKKHLDKPGALQTAIRIGSPTINKKHEDYPGLKVTDTILGGYFGSRLMKNIREEKGYTYGIRSGITSLDLSGYKVISTETGSSYTGRTLGEIFKEIEILQTNLVENEELEIVRNYMMGEMIRMFDGPFAIAESFRSLLEFGLDNSYFYRFIDKIKTITPDEIKSLANTYYKIDDLYQVTAGSR